MTDPQPANPTTPDDDEPGIALLKSIDKHLTTLNERLGSWDDRLTLETNPGTSSDPAIPDTMNSAVLPTRAGADTTPEPSSPATPTVDPTPQEPTPLPRAQSGGLGFLRKRAPTASQ